MSTSNNTQSVNITGDSHFNTECPVCFSDDTESSPMHMMPCMHRLHLECAIHLTSFECPLCRVKINNFPKNIHDSIVKNERERRDEIELDDRRALQNALQNTISPPQAVPSEPPLQLEVIAALQYLRDQGIPLRYIPVNIVVKVPRNSPRPPEGVIFSVILNHILCQISKDISSEISTDVSSDISDILEDDFDDLGEDTLESLFKEDNEQSQNIARTVQVKDM